MFLKSLTLKGFKSFADKAVLDLEPGVTVVVGPNGSGKSNVVDAVAWVLGAQGPRTMRGAKMDDVIFAGTPDRPALGRAEVALCIDNSAGLLPIEFTEVTLTRTLFRTGESEYAINGAPCRLLDVQELLSDTGIGRQQHVIVGQGQLDAVLNARPEDRRAIIEEAAGVLKYRKRREKAERRLEATEGNLLRLQDLLREVRRGLGPLERQADAARRHDGLVQERRAIALHLTGHELAGLQVRRERLTDRAAELARTEAATMARLRELDLAVLDAERDLTDAGHGDIADAAARTEALRERVRGVLALLAEKRRGTERELAAAADEGVVETLVADADRLRTDLTQVARDVADAQDRRREAARVCMALDARRDELDRLDAAGIAGLPGSGPTRPDGVNSGGTADSHGDDADRVDVAALRREIVTRRDAAARAHATAERLSARIDALAARMARGRDEESASARTAERVAAALPLAAARRDDAARGDEAAHRACEQADERMRAADAELHRWTARSEALAQALDATRDAAAAQILAGVNGVVGPLAEHVTIDAGAQDAVAAGLGDALSAVVLAGGTAARVALARLAAGDARPLLLVLGDGPPPPVELFAGARPLASYVHSPVPGVEASLARLLAGVVLVDGDWEAALAPAAEHPETTFVTRAGDRLGGRGPWRLAGRHASAATRAAYEEATERAARAREEAEAARTVRDEAHAAASRAGGDSEHARREMRHLEAERDAAETARRAAAAARTERAVEHEEATAELAAVRATEANDAAVLTDLERRLPAREEAEARTREQAAARAAARTELAQERSDADIRRRDLEMRCAAVDERRAVLARRLVEVEERLARHPEEQAAAERRRAELSARAGAYGSLEGAARELAVAVDEVHRSVREQRRRQVERASAAGSRLETLRAERAGHERELAGLREHAQRRDADEAETRVRLEAVGERIRSEFDCEPAAALDAPAPEVPAGATLAGRVRDLDRELRLMGPINPLALEEYDALRERHEFLSRQLDDVRSSRRELQRVIKAVDAEIVTVFGAAFEDVRENFDQLFAKLFPGGSGRIFLTVPDDPLNTGIEIEARPSGKNTRRLSLLSGGERSLVALAYLFAVFRARPSPFYLMDEVEAALDDVNLHRFLDLLDEFRNEAQLLVVSHQKRTMEAADSLYGVSMPPGGSSKVVSQRMRGEIVLT